jgi:hypothetical protein
MLPDQGAATGLTMTSDTRDDSTQGGAIAPTPAPVRYPTTIAVGGGVAAAVGSSFIPMNAIEGFVGAYGIAELLPAAAPPLGNTARLALSAGIGTLTAGALLALLPRGENDVMGYETAVKPDATDDQVESEAGPARSSSGISKLAGWLRTLRFGKAEADDNEVTDFADLNRLRMRIGDQHPDAPVRAPIMANSDLGVPFDSPTEPAEDTTTATVNDEGDAAPPLDLDASMTFAPPADAAKAAPPLREPALRFSPPAQELPTIDSAGEATLADSETPAAAEQYSKVPADALPQRDSDDLADVAIPELLERLERGLARRRDMAIAASDGSRTANRFMALPPSSAPGLTDAAAETPDTGSRFRLRVTPAATQDVAEAQSDTSFSITRMPDPLAIEEPALQEDPAPLVAEGPDVVEDTPAAATPPGDEDMDAALRDALATLRQLSDRQRNA